MEAKRECNNKIKIRKQPRKPSMYCASHGITIPGPASWAISAENSVANMINLPTRNECLERLVKYFLDNCIQEWPRLGLVSGQVISLRFERRQLEP